MAVLAALAESAQAEPGKLESSQSLAPVSALSAAGSQNLAVSKKTEQNKAKTEEARRVTQRAEERKVVARERAKARSKVVERRRREQRESKRDNHEQGKSVSSKRVAPLAKPKAHVAPAPSTGGGHADAQP